MTKVCKRVALSLALVFGLGSFVFAQQISKNEYVDQWHEVAIFQMQRHKIPASIILAQGILESGFGNSRLAVKANNHFGIKCHGWQGEKIYHDDDEAKECFRKYSDARQSFEDHSLFLTSRPRYAGLFQLDITDYKGWAKGLKDAGYATNPKYPQLLIDIIEKEKLYLYDQQALGGLVAERKADKKEEPAPSRKGQKGFDPGERDITVGGKSYQVYTINKRVKYILVEPGDTFYSIARAFDLSELQLRMYNDMHSKSVLKAGDKLFISPKRNRSVEQEYHLTKQGETMRDIGQQYGVKVKSLYRRNRMAPGLDPETNQKIVLKGRVPKEN
ncbi:MAG: glucosaminidase domain-containing protein [Luteibaculaceae bacterium]